MESVTCKGEATNLSVLWSRIVAHKLDSGSKTPSSETRILKNLIQKSLNGFLNFAAWETVLPGSWNFIFPKYFAKKSPNFYGKTFKQISKLSTQYLKG